ncbi:hypothetical protein AbD4_03865 [Acinetobacter baumannii]|nr:hypothetical protein KPZ59_03752 [Acinetobacter baumannii]QUX89575.1 hypothetical protein AbD4_03865 [Acinetobacter baumannii]
MKEIVVFDLDGTLLSGDSTKAWLTDKLKSNLLRFIACIHCYASCFTSYEI